VIAEDTDALDRRLLALRHDFDSAFAALPAASLELVDLVAVGVAGDRHAIHVRDLAGLVPCRKIVSLPSRTPALLGVAGIRGAVVSVYSLDLLLGYSTTQAKATWLALAGEGADVIGLAFATVEGFLRVPHEAILERDRHASSLSHVTHVVQQNDVALPIIDIASMCGAIKQNAGTTGPSKEG
jgi:chemotaxis signal transduction protein